MKAASKGGTMIAIRSSKASVIAVWSPRLVVDESDSINEFRVLNTNIFKFSLTDNAANIPQSRSPSEITDSADDETEEENANHSHNHCTSMGLVGFPADCQHLSDLLMEHGMNNWYAFGGISSKSDAHTSVLHSPARVAASIGDYIHSHTLPVSARPLCVRLCVHGFDTQQHRPLLFEVDCLGNVIPCKYACIGPFGRYIEKYLKEVVSGGGNVSEMNENELIQHVCNSIQQCVNHLKNQYGGDQQKRHHHQQQGSDVRAREQEEEEADDILSNKFALSRLKFDTRDLQVSVCDARGTDTLASINIQHTS